MWLPFLSTFQHDFLLQFLSTFQLVLIYPHGDATFSNTEPFSMIENMRGMCVSMVILHSITIVLYFRCCFDRILTNILMLRAP